MRRWSAALLLAAASLGSAAAQPWTPTPQAQLDGVWQARGYGWIVAAKAGVPALYHVAGRFCYPAPGDAMREDQSFAQVQRVSAREIRFAAAPDQTHYGFRRIARLPAACRAERSWTRADIRALIAATFADLYAGFGPRGRTPARLRAALLAADTRSDRALYDGLTLAMDTLDDAHVGLEAEIEGEEAAFESGTAASLRRARGDARLGETPEAREREWNARYRSGVAMLLGREAKTVANRRISWGHLGDLGYLNFLTMGAFDPDKPDDDTAALDAVLDEAIGSFHRGKVRGVIVDVTSNRGGYDAISLHIARRFADGARLAYTKRPANGPGAAQAFEVVPSDRVRWDGPVTLLVSDVTVSAGEVFALAMRALPNVRVVGATTRGALSDQLSKKLPNGWTLTLPAETYRDPAGRALEGVGIVPDEARPVFEPSYGAFLAELARATKH